MKRTSFKGNTCPVARSLDVLGDWWTLLIVRNALNGQRRFGEFQKSLGLAKNVLAARLKALVGHGLLETVPASDGSAWQEYRLTEKGAALFPVLVALRQWGEDYLVAPGEPHSQLLERATGKPVGRLELRGQDGTLLAQPDTMLLYPPKPPAA